MKKIVIVFLGFVLLMINSLVVFAEENEVSKEIVLLVGSNQSIVNGVKIQIDKDDLAIKPIIQNGRTLVPIRFIAENFDAKVVWDENTKGVKIIKDQNILELMIGVPQIKKNGITIELDATPRIISGRAFLPLRVIAESMGKVLFYENNLIIISDVTINYDNNFLSQLRKKLNSEIALLVGSNQSIVNGLRMMLDSDDYNIKTEIKNNRTLVPIRFISERFGAEVTEKLEIAPQIINGRTYVPLRATIEAIGKNIYYDNGLIILSDVAVNYDDSYLQQMVNKLQTIPKTTSEVATDSIKSVVIVEVFNEGEEQGFGTGFFVGDGLVMTAFHVIEDYEEIRVEDYFGNVYEVEGIYKYDITRDLVVLKLDKQQSVKSLKLGEMSSSVVGEKVVAIGHSNGLSWSVTEGIISSFREDKLMNSLSIQTDAVVSHGSSGGPLLNSNGKVIGVITKGIENENYNFAVIPDGKMKVDYQLLDFDNLDLINDTEFIISKVEEQNVFEMIDDSLRGLVKNDKNLYLSTIHPKSPLLEVEKDNFSKESADLKGYSYRINGIDSKKYGDTIISVANITFYGYNTINTNVLSRLAYDNTEKKYKFMATILYLDKNNLDQKADENQPLWIVDKSYNFFKELEFKPYDVKFDNENGFVYMIDKTTKSLVRYSVRDNVMVTKSFEYVPDRLDLVDGKVYVTLLTKEHNTYSESESYIGIVNADTLEVIKIIKIMVDPYDITVKDGIIYVSTGSYLKMIKSYSENTGLEIDSYDALGVLLIENYPNGDKLYAIATNAYPRDLQAFGVDNGKFVMNYDSIYHGEYKIDLGFKLSPDGKYIFNYSGVIFKTGFGKEGDMLYHKRFSGPYNSIAFDLSDNKIYINPTDSNYIYAYDYTTLEYLASFKTETQVYFMGVIDDKLVTIENEGGSNGINVIKIK
ncbi:hypothetical protein BHF71_10775 [Vulcanibacillus modesticaldus]|uniref:Copper amine oxidase-like N-terminal domain-containing protein n=1 Tax=Vulcanibacillus modesticaldus TaxID=337097 RepID=A0A1D2YT01_9BACI|nr:stalk domain-containing protein [Vulcanibacillus modesticaldus]OEF98834.1 hypothetical protein BHF71_10775 [Vulcanibacillus modesticaldus]